MLYVLKNKHICNDARFDVIMKERVHCSERNVSESFKKKFYIATQGAMKCQNDLICCYLFTSEMVMVWFVKHDERLGW